MSWSTELRDLFTRPLVGVVEPTAYDTAWVARVPSLDDDGAPAFPSALAWLLEHQRADGSWGASLEYHHDRLQSTLRAVLTLAHWQRRQGHTRWQDRINTACVAFAHHATLLARDPYDLIGFELILPTLLQEARALGLPLPFDAFATVHRLREEKLARIPPELVYTAHTTVAFSAEFLGATLDAARMSAVRDAQGSLACSPSATAFHLLAAPGDDAARAYLAKTLTASGGAAPAVSPIDIFEAAWALREASWVWPTSGELSPAMRAAVEPLRRELTKKRGAAHSSHFAVADLDTTSMVARVLSWAGEAWDVEVFKPFEEADHFRCYGYERNPSVSSHVHLIEALRHAPPSAERERMLVKARGFLERTRVEGTFWFDKWHASPCYTTGHAVVALGRDPALVDGAVRWIVETQRADGSWGHYGAGTAEETAYCLQALTVHRRRGGAVAEEVVARAVAYLEASPERIHRRYAPLWIGKTLYTPPVVVHAAVLGALALGAS